MNNPFASTTLVLLQKRLERACMTDSHVNPLEYVGLSQFHEC